MKKWLFLMTMFISQITLAQEVKSPVSWAYSVEKTSSTEAVITLTANLEPNWRIYSQFVKDNGPVKTAFDFMPAKGYELVGKTTESEPLMEYSSAFKMNIGYFEKTAVFRQKIKLKDPSPTIKCKIAYGPCDNRVCLMPDEITLDIKVD